jgi:hypothetical protein
MSIISALNPAAPVRWTTPFSTRTPSRSCSAFWAVPTVRAPGRLGAPLAFPIVIQFRVVLFYGRAGRLTAQPAFSGPGSAAPHRVQLPRVERPGVRLPHGVPPRRLQRRMFADPPSCLLLAMGRNIILLHATLLYMFHLYGCGHSHLYVSYYLMRKSALQENVFTAHG